ncbi:hypothetical protein GWI33_000405 [Rhynchophorus ferrugineus]|uniref:Uncharacterized protein n=1 Tax=Rhynchophorus ferrugineus TaxID=354439 RepID=A0A834HLB4_RHYFE|nr:hypothetical protein GWI33_000405 [Rhynchophorus ferrugineus]
MAAPGYLADNDGCTAATTANRAAAAASAAAAFVRRRFFGLTCRPHLTGKMRAGNIKCSPNRAASVSLRNGLWRIFPERFRGTSKVHTYTRSARRNVGPSGERGRARTGVEANSNAIIAKTPGSPHPGLGAFHSFLELNSNETEGGGGRGGGGGGGGWLEATAGAGGERQAWGVVAAASPFCLRSEVVAD